MSLRAPSQTATLASPIVLVVLGVMAAPGLRAQTDLALEVGASQVGPASGLDTGDARFAIGGLRVSSYGSTGSGIFASVLGGQAFGDSVGGSFVSGFAEATLIDRWSAAWSGVISLKVLGFAIAEPHPYRTVAVELTPSVRVRTRHVSLELGVLGGVGRSRVERTGRLGRTLVFEDEHWRVGTTGELLVGSQTLQVGLAGGTHRASGEDYHSVGARLVTGGGWGVVELGADRWETPLGWETTGGLSLAIPLGGDWSFRGFFGRSDPDPLTLTQPGSGSGGALLGWSLYNDRPAARAPLHELLERTASGGRIRVAVEAPEEVRSVQLLGDFTLWEPVAMRREGDRWVAEVEVGVGAHHFGFLVDDEWYLPDDALDVVPDEWGRRSATLVIEGAGR